MIADEAHYTKTLRWKRSAWSGTIRAKVLFAIAAETPRRIYLTGTPIDRPQDLWAILVQLDPHTWKPNGFHDFARRYCNAHHNGFGWDTSGASNLEELQRVLRSTVMVRRRKGDVLKELPAKTRTVIALAPAPEDVAAEQPYLPTIREDFTELEFVNDVRKLESTRRIRFEEMSKLRRSTAVRKIGKVVQFCKEQLESREKLILFAHHSKVVDELRAALSAYNPVVVKGSTSVAARQAAVDAFQADPKVKLFIGNIEAAGVGITLTAASAVVFAELDWRPSAMTQAEDRAHRIGQKDNVEVFHVVLDGSIDASVARMLIEKQGAIDKALD